MNKINFSKHGHVLTHHRSRQTSDATTDTSYFPPEIKRFNHFKYFSATALVEYRWIAQWNWCCVKTNCFAEKPHCLLPRFFQEFSVFSDSFPFHLNTIFIMEFSIYFSNFCLVCNPVVFTGSSYFLKLKIRWFLLNSVESVSEPILTELTVGISLVANWCRLR